MDRIARRIAGDAWVDREVREWDRLGQGSSRNSWSTPSINHVSPPDPTKVETVSPPQRPEAIKQTAGDLSVAQMVEVLA